MLAPAEPVGDRELIAFELERAAVLAAGDAGAPGAGRLIGAADAVREPAGSERNAFDTAWLERHLGAVAGTEFGPLEPRGRALEVKEALSDARRA